MLDVTYLAFNPASDCPTLSPFSTGILFYAYTTFLGPFAYFLLHLWTPYSGLPTHLSVYQTRTPFCDTALRIFRLTRRKFSTSGHISGVPRSDGLSPACTSELPFRSGTETSVYSSRSCRPILAPMIRLGMPNRL